MNMDRRINDFSILGEIFGEFAENKGFERSLAIAGKDLTDDFLQRIENARRHNPWFTSENIREALAGLAFMLQKNKLEKWLQAYPNTENQNASPATVGIVMAGNIPLVGFHDLLSVLITGNKAMIKLSASDNHLWPAVFEVLYRIGTEYRNRIELSDGNLKNFDAIIATGSNNTSRYFEYYFGKYPHIIRKNRNGIAILKGDETDEQLRALGKDIFSFFGLGCRNVSKIYIPGDFDLDRVFRQLYDYNDIIHHHSYANNFDYNRSIMLLNNDDLLENGFVLFKPSREIASPLACVYYERYFDYGLLRKQLEDRQEEIQCIISQEDVPFGQAQKPELWDYADGVNTIEFLLSLKK